MLHERQQSSAPASFFFFSVQNVRKHIKPRWRDLRVQRQKKERENHNQVGAPRRLPVAAMCATPSTSLAFPPAAPPLNSLRPTSQTINKCLLMRRSGGPLSFIISLTVNCSVLILITIRRSLIAPHLVARPRRRCPTRGPSGDSGVFSSR